MAEVLPVVTTSLVVSFDTEEAEDQANSVFAAQVDTRPAEEGGYNNGKSTFYPGDSVYILLFKTPNIQTVGAKASVGSIGKSKNDTFLVEAFMSFTTFTTENSLSYPLPASGISAFSYEWIGTNLGALTSSGIAGGHTLIKLVSPPTAKRTYSYTKQTAPYTVGSKEVLLPFAGAISYSYSAPCEVWVLDNTYWAADEYQIVVDFVGINTSGYTVV